MKVLTLILFGVFALTFVQGCFSQSKPIGKSFGQTAVFRVGGNVYPDGYFYATLNIGEPPRPYALDIDTGSDLSWVQCDAPCVSCHKSPHKPYKPRNNNLLSCKDPICTLVQHPTNHPCHNPSDQCDYEVQYADHGSSLGVLVKDHFPLRFLNGSSFRPSLAFGCGYNQEISSSSAPPFTDGVLGLANRKSSFLSQLTGLGLTRNVFGHCFSGQGGGHLFFGDDIVPSSTIWVPMTQNHIGPYSIGPAELSFDGKSLVNGGLSLVFDSGSTYTYLNSQAYTATLSMIKKNIDSKHLKEAPEDKTLTICWKGARPFKSITDVKKIFKSLSLRFPNAKNAVMEIPPESYLIISKKGNVCLGILDGSKARLGNLNVLGDITLLDKMVIYDNERNQIGWVPAKCDKLS